MNIQGWFCKVWLLWSPCSPRDSQEPSPVQGTLKSLLQHHNFKASILQHSAFFMVQLTSVHDYWKNHTDLWFHRHLSAKWCLCFLIHCLGLCRIHHAECQADESQAGINTAGRNNNNLRYLTFFPRSKCLLLSGCSHHLQWFWNLRKYCHCFHIFPIYLLWSYGTRCHDLNF